MDPQPIVIATGVALLEGAKEFLTTPCPFQSLSTLRRWVFSKTPATPSTPSVYHSSGVLYRAVWDTKAVARAQEAEAKMWLSVCAYHCNLPH